jgi:hypothetical protein
MLYWECRGCSDRRVLQNHYSPRAIARRLRPRLRNSLGIGVHAVIGDCDKAMAWLERSVDTGFACWPFFRIDPHLENLRERVEFTRLVADLEDKYTSLEILSASSR